MEGQTRRIYLVRNI